jgi:hypothetical protein
MYPIERIRVLEMLTIPSKRAYDTASLPLLTIGNIHVASPSHWEAVSQDTVISYAIVAVWQHEVSPRQHPGRTHKPQGGPSEAT